MAEGKRVAKKKTGEKVTIILKETNVNAKDNSKSMSKIDEIQNPKGERPMAEEKVENQGAKWTDMMMGMINNVPAFTTSQKAMEPLMELTKMQQQGFTNMYRVWSDQLGKIGEASRSGDVKKVLETYVESNKEIFNTCQEVVKDQAAAQYELLRKFIPALPNLPETRS